MKHKFIDYPKEYEDVFCLDEGKKKYSVPDISTSYPDGYEAYKSSFTKYFKDTSYEIFMQYVKYYWFQRKFAFKGRVKKKYMRNHYTTDNAFSFFCRHTLKTNNTVLWKSFMFYKVFTFIMDWYPDIDDHDPFIDKEYYKWPFKNITIDFLTVVYQMPERMDILKYADDRDMSYLEFLDYVINYIYVFNERHKNNYIYSFVHRFREYPPYVRYNTSWKNTNRNKKNVINKFNPII